MISFLGRYAFQTMEWIYVNVTHNYALSIVILTVLLKLVTLPADILQKVTTRKTASLSPQLEKIKKKYTGDAQLISKKTQELYKANNVNQYAGCLPLVISFLFLIVFFNGMTAWANVSTAKLFLETQAGNASYISNYKWLWVNNIWMPDSGIAPIVMKAANFAKIPFDSLSHYFDATKIASLKAVAAQITPTNTAAYDSVMQPVVAQFGNVMNGWFVLPLIAGASMLLQQFLTLKFTPQTPGQPGMGKGMLYGMSAVSIIICFQYNTAFSIYWIVSNIMSITTTVILGIILKPKTKSLEAI